MCQVFRPEGTSQNTWPLISLLDGTVPNPVYCRQTFLSSPLKCYHWKGKPAQTIFRNRLWPHSMFILIEIPDEQFYSFGGVNVCYPETIGISAIMITFNQTKQHKGRHELNSSFPLDKAQPSHAGILAQEFPPFLVWLQYFFSLTFSIITLQIFSNSDRQI